MTDHEIAILNFLRITPETAYSRKEIGRKALRRREYEEDPDWVNVPLASLVARDLVEVDKDGYYKFRKSTLDL